MSKKISQYRIDFYPDPKSHIFFVESDTRTSLTVTVIMVFFYMKNGFFNSIWHGTLAWDNIACPYTIGVKMIRPRNIFFFFLFEGITQHIFLLRNHDIYYTPYSANGLESEKNVQFLGKPDDLPQNRLKSTEVFFIKISNKAVSKSSAEWRNFFKKKLILAIYEPVVVHTLFTALFFHL